MRLEDLLPVITETLEAGKEFTLPVTGTSMLPLLVQKRDTVTLKKPDAPLKKGDLPLYRRSDGSFVLHRIVDVRDGAFVMCGDNQFDLEYPVMPEQIIGVVAHINRNGKTLDAENSGSYKAYVKLHTAALPVRYPLRRLRRRLHKSIESTDITAAKQRTKELSRTELYLIAAIKSALNGTAAPELYEGVTAEGLFGLAHAHRVANIVAYSFKGEQFKKELFKVVARNASNERELSKIEAAFSDAGIRYCILKGAALAALYPSPDMRFSLDTDIYVDASEVEKAGALLEGMGYTREETDMQKEIGYRKKPYMNVELHFSLNYETDSTHECFKELVGRLVPSRDNEYRLEMLPEDLIMYLTGHTAHHFLSAGTGIRSVTDAYLIDKNLRPLCNEELLDKRLAEAGLTEFYNKLTQLSEYWFGAGEPGEITGDMASYIMKSGIYGTDEHYYVNATVGSNPNGGSRSKYIVKRIFPSLTAMQAGYPVLNRAPVLLPIFWGVRCVKVLGEAKKYKSEATAITAVDSDSRKGREDMFNELGL